MTVTGTARAALHDALVAHPELPAGRVHRFRPDVPATPTVWVGDATRYPRTDDGFAELRVAFDVVALVDGADRAALEALDAYGDAIVDAALAAGFVLTAGVATLLDVGGPNLHAATITVEWPVAAPTLCPSTPLIGARA